MSITGLEGGGRLELDGLPITATGTPVTKEQVDNGQLVFHPAENESGFNHESLGGGVGNGQQDYAKINYQLIDSEGQFSKGELTIDIDAVVDEPFVEVTLTKVGGDESSGSPITKVNGGSGKPGGFDIQDGKIVAIGEGVRVWGTVDADGKNPTEQPIDQLSGIKIPDGVNPSDVLLAYGNSNGGTNANSNAEDLTDIFILNENSGFYKDNNHWAKMDAFTGNRGQGYKPDYVFIDATPGTEYQVTGWTNNVNGQINTYENVNITNVVKGPNHIEAVLDGAGFILEPSNKDLTKIEKEDLGSVSIEYEVGIKAHVTDEDGSEWLGDLTLEGIPAGATVTSAGELPAELTLEQVNGQWMLKWDPELANDAKQAVDLTLKVADVPSDADFSGVTVHVNANELTSQGISSHAAFASDSLSDDSDGSTPSADTSQPVGIESGLEAEGNVGVMPMTLSSFFDEDDPFTEQELNPVAMAEQQESVAEVYTKFESDQEDAATPQAKSISLLSIDDDFWGGSDGDDLAAEKAVGKAKDAAATSEAKEEAKETKALDITEVLGEEEALELNLPAAETKAGNDGRSKTVSQEKADADKSVDTATDTGDIGSQTFDDMSNLFKAGGSDGIS
ncbi:hypothetical protein [Paenalcaligenes faecalis]|uniref:hypothetical protein n=1 Tax=Paenalcaligenes faecalis TaxID=2980099 RepID=UPI0022B97D46|nr:hypothetical protein [Paenalcaligenes faecalis]